MAETGTPPHPAPVGTLNGGTDRSHINRRLFRDRFARLCVMFGGFTIILVILAILFVILAQIYPLFAPSTLSLARSVSVALPESPLAVDIEEYQEFGYTVTPGGLSFIKIADGTVLSVPPLAAMDSAKVTGVSALGGRRFVLGLSDGRILPIDVSFSTSYDSSGNRVILPGLISGEALAVRDRQPVTLLASVATEEGPVTVVSDGPNRLVVAAITEQISLNGEATRTVSTDTITLPINGEVRAMAVDESGRHLYLGTSTGQVAMVERGESGGFRLAGVVDVTGKQGTAITAMGFLLGARTLIVGDASGGISSWQALEEPGGEKRLHRIYTFDATPGAVLAIAASRRDKGFVTLDAGGTLHLAYGTTGKTLAIANGDVGQPISLAFSPKANGVVVIGTTGKLAQWTIDNPHPEATWSGLFGKIWYEGSPGPEYSWQSTGGTDQFEPKFSLIPLIFGTLKGTFYSLLFAIPVAILAALYVSQFINPRWKVYIKPIVEIMAALPSVVLGFIAGLWLAPVVERYVPALFLIPITLPACVLLAHYLWRFAPDRFHRLIRPGTEVVLLIPAVVIGMVIALSLGSVVEAGMMAGDYGGWLFQTLGLTYDQRNSLVVGFAMGFAVIPIMFTIAEDSLSSVPPSLVAGSLALGATRWQTALRVVLPSASPGIFSAIMIGFGRAVGETMIVLMATGNTPVLDWSIFNGFRALSANIAVELPEAPDGGTLYRILFLAAFLLFVATFIVNTIAEVVRIHLRKKYRYL